MSSPCIRYYYNRATNESSWEKPAALDTWEKAQTAALGLDNWASSHESKGAGEAGGAGGGGSGGIGDAVEVGVCFCGAPVIGKDLATMCSKYSSMQDKVLFKLHKENF